MSNIQRFIDSIEVPNTAKVVRYVLDRTDYKIEKFSQKQMEKFILEKQPSSQKAIVTICYVLGLYGHWLYEQGIIKEDSVYELVQTIDKKNLWKRAKPNAKKKFVTREMYRVVFHDIGVYEEYNALYFQTVFRCVYEGVYNDDLSILKNLRASDISGNVLTLQDDGGNEYEFRVSNELADAMKELSNIHVWERRNRFGLCRVSSRGKYYDSVFKVEERSTASEESFRFTVYSKLRKISTEYIGYSVLPYQLYISGIMHRICDELKRNNISVREAFAPNCRSEKVHRIIAAELSRCNYGADISNFKEIVSGHLECFE